MLTEAQMKWAEGHDWFMRREGDTIIVRDRWTTQDGQAHEVVRPWLETFRDLRIWAGY